MPSELRDDPSFSAIIKRAGPLTGPLTLITVAVYAARVGRFQNEKIQLIFDAILLVMVGAGVLLSILSLSGMAKSLGYSVEVPSPREIQVSDELINADTIPTKPQPLAAEKYDEANVLSPLDNARFRILEHIAKLRNNSVFNLYIGLGIAFAGILILFSAILQIEQFADKEKHVFDTNGFVFFALLPKLSVTVFSSDILVFFPRHVSG
jgi:hypothetical protein